MLVPLYTIASTSLWVQPEWCPAHKEHPWKGRQCSLTTELMLMMRPFWGWPSLKSGRNACAGVRQRQGRQVKPTADPALPAGHHTLAAVWMSWRGACVLLSAQDCTA